LSYFGGILDLDNYQYKFNVGNHIQRYLLEESDTLYSNKYLLFPSKGSTPADMIETYPAKIILNGSDSDIVPTLKLIYSIIPD
jgi:hypothetical protein